jgi:hypothetical protein
MPYIWYENYYKIKYIAMNALVVILSGLLQSGTIAGLNPLPENTHLISINLFGLLNGQFLFILKFFGEILLVFFMGGVIGKFLHLDNVQDKTDSNLYS